MGDTLLNVEDNISVIQAEFQDYDYDYYKMAFTSLNKTGDRELLELLQPEWRLHMQERIVNEPDRLEGLYSDPRTINYFYELSGRDQVDDLRRAHQTYYKQKNMYELPADIELGGIPDGIKQIPN